MPTERVVEVVVLWCEQCADLASRGCLGSHGPAGNVGTRTALQATLAPSSLAAAMLTLAEAVLAVKEADLAGAIAMQMGYDLSAHAERYEQAEAAMDAALAAVRNHPDYVGPE